MEGGGKEAGAIGGTEQWQDGKCSLGFRSDRETKASVREEFRQRWRNPVPPLVAKLLIS